MYCTSYLVWIINFSVVFESGYGRYSVVDNSFYSHPKYLNFLNSFDFWNLLRKIEASIQNNDRSIYDLT